MKINGPVYMYKCSIVNNYNEVKNSNCQRTQSEDAPFEDVTPRTKDEVATNIKPAETNKDYSSSPLIPYMTYPALAQYLLAWFHKRMNNQPTVKERLKPFKAAHERGLFKCPVPYEAFIAEFGFCISQTWYSRLMSSGDNYSDDELTLAIETLDLSVFK